MASILTPTFLLFEGKFVDMHMKFEQIFALVSKRNKTTYLECKT